MNICNSQISKSEIGETVLAPVYPQRAESLPDLDVIHSAGWHRVNKSYKYDRPNGTTDFLLIFTVSGQGKACVEGKNFDLTANTAFIIQPYSHSEYHTSGNDLWEFYWMHICGPNATNILSAMTANRKYLLDISHTNIFKRIEQIMTPVCAFSEKYFYAAKSISKILFDMVYVINRELTSETDIADELISYLEQENIHINLNEFANEHYMSVANLIRVFSKKTGETPYSYHRTYKMTKAAQRLIYTKIQIKTIATIAGYSSKSAFSTQFFKMYGISPSEYRKRYKVYQN